MHSTRAPRRGTGARRLLGVLGPGTGPRRRPVRARNRGRGVARSATHDGFAFDLSGNDIPAALALAVRQLGVRRIQAYGREAGRVGAFADALKVQVDVAQAEADLGSVEGAVNLLQGSFAQGGMLSGLMPLAGRAAGTARRIVLKAPLPGPRSVSPSRSPA